MSSPAPANDEPWAEVDLAALAHNLERIRSRTVGGAGILAAVKADAYGHGAVPVARRLEQLGVPWFGVATGAEAHELRARGVTNNILIFGPVYEGLAELIAAEVALTVVDEASLDAVRRADGGRAARVHVKVDTGMGRLGLVRSAATALAQAADTVDGIDLEGVWTHFAASDDPDTTHTKAQLISFREVLEALESQGIRPPLIHAANSAAIFAHPSSHFDLVRPGIGLYGYHSSAHIAALERDLRPVMTLRAPITFVKRVAAGTAISYGSLWRAPESTTVATVRLGYADGYPRLLSNRGVATWQGAELRIVGRVCMDQLMLDAGDHPVAVGERVVLFGRSGPDGEALAATIGTISYELLTGISPRVPRVYLGG